VLFLAGAAGSFAAAQATATATSSGVSLHAGGGYSYFQADYGKRALGGYTIFADYNRTPRWGIEFQVRALRFNQEFGTHQTTLLIGPRYVYRRPRYQAYAKLLVGEGLFHFPYNYAEGTYFVLAPGGGIDVPVGRSRFTVRAAEIEYQSWPQFSFGGLSPYGFSAGFSYRILHSAQGR
jgi:hypothetical protein